MPALQEDSAPASADWADRLLELASSKRAQQRSARKSPKFKSFYDYTNGDAADVDDDDREAGGPTSFKRLPQETKYFDTASIFVKAGDGGAGSVAFMRDKNKEFGGPSGGNGGRGGAVWAVADPSMNSLFAFRQKVHWRAESGQPGQGKDCHGLCAPDLLIPVPPGTIIRRKVRKSDGIALPQGGRRPRPRPSRQDNPVLAALHKKGSSPRVMLMCS